MTAKLPYDCWEVYYKDEIGNISTSNALKGVNFLLIIKKLHGES